MAQGRDRTAKANGGSRRLLNFASVRWLKVLVGLALLGYGGLVLSSHPDDPPLTFIGMVTLVGLVPLLHGLGLWEWHRAHVTAGRSTLTIDTMFLGIRLRRETFPLSNATTLGPSRGAPEIGRRVFLSLRSPNAPPLELPVFDSPRTRAMLEAILGSAKRSQGEE